MTPPYLVRIWLTVNRARAPDGFISCLRSLGVLNVYKGIQNWKRHFRQEKHISAAELQFYRFICKLIRAHHARNVPIACNACQSHTPAEKLLLLHGGQSSTRTGPSLFTAVA